MCVLSFPLPDLGNWVGTTETLQDTPLNSLFSQVEGRNESDQEKLKLYVLKLALPGETPAINSSIKKRGSYKIRYDFYLS